MELPIDEFPSYVEEMSTDVTHLFDQARQLTHLKRLMIGYVVADKNSISHMNGLFTFHTNQFNLNRFITCSNRYPWEMNKVKMRMINEIESDAGNC